MAACATRSKRRSRPQKRNCTLLTGREMVEPRLHEVEAEPTLLASCRSCPPPLYSSLLRVPIRVEMFEACRVAVKGTGLRIRLAAVLVHDLKVQKILCGSKLVRSDARATEELTQALTNIVTFGFFGRMIACSLTFKILARLHSLLGLLRNVLSSVDEAERCSNGSGTGGPVRAALRAGPLPCAHRPSQYPRPVLLRRHPCHTGGTPLSAKLIECQLGL